MTKILRISGEGLVRLPDMPAAQLDSGQPVQHGRGWVAEDGLRIGVWGATPYALHPKTRPNTEASFLLEGAVALTVDGVEVRVTAGEAMVVPPGLLYRWVQDVPVRKVYLMFEGPMERADLAVFRGGPDAPAPARSADGRLAVGPFAHAEGRPAGRTGVHELVHLVAGSVRLEEAGAPPVVFSAGDTFFIPAGTDCAWLSVDAPRGYACTVRPGA